LLKYSCHCRWATSDFVSEQRTAGITSSQYTAMLNIGFFKEVNIFRESERMLSRMRSSHETLRERKVHRSLLGCIIMCNPDYWHCPHSMRSRVYATVRPFIRRVCCCGPGIQETSIDCCTVGGPAVSSSRAAARRAAANASSVPLSADVGS